MRREYGESACDLDAYREALRDGRGDHATHAEVRDTQEWRTRTVEETQVRGEVTK